QMRRSLGGFARKAGRKANAPIDARGKKRSSQPDERRIDARRTASRVPARGQSRPRSIVAAAPRAVGPRVFRATVHRAVVTTLGHIRAKQRTQLARVLLN